MSLREASGWLQAVGLALWLTKDAVDLSLAATQAAGVAKALMVRVIQKLVVEWLCRDWWSCWDVRWWEERFFFRVPLVDDSCWLFLVLSLGWLGHKYLILSLPICVELGLRGPYSSNLQP